MSASTTTTTIIVVDDSPAVRVFFEKIAATLDVELRTYPSAAAAMAFLADRQPSLLFLDIIMPEKDGLTFLEELRRMPLHADTSTVVISSKDYAQDRVAAKQLGAVEFVAKPMTTRTIQELIGKHTGAGPRPAAPG